MFNHNPSANQPRAPHPNGDPSYGFADQAWAKYGFNTSLPSNDPSQPLYGPRPSFSAASDMDWAPSPSPSTSTIPHAAPQGNAQFAAMTSPQDGGAGAGAGRGVGRLVAHFENKGFVPPLPPRPANPATSHMSVNPGPSGISSPFGSFSLASPNATTPLASPDEPNFDLLGDPCRIPSSMASPPPMAFGGFHDTSRVSSPVVPSSTGAWGSLDNFMANNRVTSPLIPTEMASPPMNAPTIVTSPVTSPNPGTPGFLIWRPPVPMTRKPTIDQTQINDNQNNSSGYFKPPVPSTPKPVMNAGTQFIIDFNSNANTKAKGKAPARAPPKQPPRKPSRQQIPAPTPSVFSPVKQEHEPATPELSQPSTSSNIPAERRPSVSSRSQAGSRPTREQVPAEAWESLKSTIRALYLEERKPLKEVMSIMADKYGFQATPKMYKTRFSQWGFVKNNTEEEVKRLLSMKFQRDAEGKVSEFVRNGRVVNLGTYLKRKGVTEYDLVDFELPADLPAHIRCRTPTPPPGPGYLRSPDLLRAQETVISNMRKAFLHYRQSEVESETQVSWPSTMVWGAGSSDMLLEANFYFEMKDTDQGGQFLMRAFKQLELDLKKLSPQGINELLLGMVHRDPGMMTALCKYLAAYSTTNFERAHPLRQIFSCLYDVQQKHGSTTLSDLLWASIPTIAEELEAIYGRRHPYVARTWIDLALFYNHSSPERLEKMVGELRVLQRQIEIRQGTDSVDVLALRYAIVQLMFCARPQLHETRQAAVELWNHIRKLGLVFPVRDARPNVYCYHSPVKVDPWKKRCRRRYDSGVQIMQEHAGVKVIPYFEEDYHHTEHVPVPAPVPASVPAPLSAQDSWAAAMNHSAGQGRWGGLI